MDSDKTEQDMGLRTRPQFMGSAGGVGKLGDPNVPQPDKKLHQLLNIINGTIGRSRDALARYATMNDGLTGLCDEKEKEAAVSSAPSGLLYELIDRAEYLNSLCDDFDRENNRLNQIITDG